MAEAGARVLTVIVPAHNEAGGIAATLRALGAGDAGGDADADLPAVPLIVACNACADDTAAVARRAAPHARVLDIAERGKANAINRALALAPEGQVIVLDADVVLPRRVLTALAEALDQPGVLAASPAVRFDGSGASALARGYITILGHNPYHQRGIGGALMREMIAAGKARGFARVELEILSDNHAMQALARRFTDDFQMRNGNVFASVDLATATV